MKPEKAIEKLMKVNGMGEKEAKALVTERMRALTEKKRREKIEDILNDLTTGGKKK